MEGVADMAGVGAGWGAEGGEEGFGCWGGHYWEKVWVELALYILSLMKQEYCNTKFKDKSVRASLEFSRLISTPLLITRIHLSLLLPVSPYPSSSSTNITKISVASAKDSPQTVPSLKLGLGFIPASRKPLAGTNPSGEERIQIVPPVIIIRTRPSG